MSLKVGVNLWQAMQWAEDSQYGDRRRLLRELDTLQKINVDHVRILASSQGTMEENGRMENRIFPSSENSPGIFRSESEVALEYLFGELEKRNMKAIVVLNNFWHWSGGFSQYQMWTKKIQYKQEIANGYGATAKVMEMYPIFKMSAAFFEDTDAQEMYFQSSVRILKKFSKWYPRVILSWQLANEPTPLGNQEKFYSWIEKSIKKFKEILPSQDFSMGGVGTGPIPFVGTYTSLDRVYQSKKFSLLTVHLWPENWGWYYPLGFYNASFMLTKFLSKMYLWYHAWKAKKLGVPMILEEVGLARDERSFSKKSSRNYRNEFFKFVIEELKDLRDRGYPVFGITFWAWGGEGDPGKNAVGDPPHEPQGWYSIFSSDEDTLSMIRDINRF